MATREGQEQDSLAGKQDGTIRFDQPAPPEGDEPASERDKQPAVDKSETEIKVPVDAEAVFETWKGDLKHFYKTIRRYYGEEEWTVLKIYEHSSELRPLIDALRNTLEKGDVTVHSEQDRLLAELVSEAQGAKDTLGFWKSISQRKTMAPKTPLAKLYDAIVRGSNAEQESVRKAA